MNKEEELIDRLIDLAFAEDIGDGDHTTLSCIPATAMGKSKLLIKEPGILAGIDIIAFGDISNIFFILILQKSKYIFIFIISL